MSTPGWWGPRKGSILYISDRVQKRCVEKSEFSRLFSFPVVTKVDLLPFNAMINDYFIQIGTMAPPL